MGRIAAREQLVRNLVRLRRAERRHGRDDDIVAVRRDLERAVGTTVTRAMAARLLGVTQPALERWIAAGDVPAVLTPGGRREVPVAALLELAEAIEDRDDRHPLAAVLADRRRAADALDVSALVRVDSRAGHRLAELRGLAYHRAVARRLDQDMVADASQRLRRRVAGGHGHPVSIRRWSELLAQPLPRIAAAISADDDAGRALRQTSPFAGALSEPERRRILRAVGP